MSSASLQSQSSGAAGATFPALSAANATMKRSISGASGRNGMEQNDSKPVNHTDRGQQHAVSEENNGRPSSERNRRRSTPVHSIRDSGTYSPDQVVGVEGPPISYWRPTGASDLARIAQMLSAESKEIFGDLSIPEAINTCVLGVSQVNALGEVVACLCLSHWPPSQLYEQPVPTPTPAPAPAPGSGRDSGEDPDDAVPPAPVDPLQELEPRLTPSNSLLIRLLVWDGRYLSSCARLLMHSVFVTMPMLDHLVLALPPKAQPNEVLSRLLEPVRGFKPTAGVSALLVSHRGAFTQPLRIRKAECEDNEDLLQIFDQQAYRLRELYGDFYISELISNPESRQIVVAEEPTESAVGLPRRGGGAAAEGPDPGAEARRRAVGIMVLNTDVNLTLLNAHFSLLPFYGLRQPHVRDVLNLPGWVKPRPEMADALLHQAAVAAQAVTEEPASSSSSLKEDSEVDAAVATPREGLAARAARLVREALERKRRRWRDPQHYLSELSITLEERDEPLDPYHVEAASDSDSPSASESESEDSIVPVFGRQKKKKQPAQTSSAMLTTTFEFIPEFKGQPNAFLIELFALSELCDERLAFDFLLTSYKLFPELDYCALTVPHAYPTFSLLDHFVRVAPRETRHFHQELYVAHRCAFASELQVRAAGPEDLPGVHRLLRTLKRGLGQALADLREAVQGAPHLKAFVASCMDQIVGVAVISGQCNLEYVSCHFAVSRWVSVELLEAGDCGALRLCVLTPALHQRSGLFLRELHRLSQTTCFFHELQPRLQQQSPAALAVPSMLDDLVPVAPRPPPSGLDSVSDARSDSAGSGSPGSRSEGTQGTQGCERSDAPCYALYMSTARLVALPKASVNLRVVVVGASDAALAFLETLVFSSPEVRYNNLTLVSVDGMPGEAECGPLVERFRPSRGRYTHRMLTNLQLGAWVSLVTGRVTRVHRTEKLVEVDGCSLLPYDFLFLFCGQQFELSGAARGPQPFCAHYPDGEGQPAAIGAAADLLVGADEAQSAQGITSSSRASADLLVEADETQSAQPAEPAEPAERAPEQTTQQAQQALPPELATDPPENVFLLNTDMDVARALHCLQLLGGPGGASQDKLIVVYGSWHCPELLSCVAGLLHWGVSPRGLLIVDPEPLPAQQDYQPYFGGSQVDKAVLCGVGAAGVRVCWGLGLSGWQAQGVRATHVTLQPRPGAELDLLYDICRKDSEEDIDPLAPLTIKCLGLFFFGEKIIHPLTFTALVDSGLVTDGLLVIDRLGRTNDPFILAGGPCTAYQRKLMAPDMLHANHNSVEIGRKLGERMRRAWDPVLLARAQVQERSASASWTTSAASFTRRNTDSTITKPGETRSKSHGVAVAARGVLGVFARYAEVVPLLTAPVVLGCELPGGLHYLSVRSPGSCPVSEQAGKRLQTGDPAAGNYCSVLVDAAGFVRGLTCLSQSPVPVPMLVSAYGQQEDTLSQVPDLLAYLSSSVMGAVYHRDPHLDTAWQEDLDTLFGFPFATLTPIVTEAMKSNNWEQPSSARLAELQLVWAETREQRAVDLRVARLLQEHGYAASRAEVQDAVRGLLKSQ